MAIAISASAAANPIHVDAGATGANNGSSWANAYNSLQDALDATRMRNADLDPSNDVSQIWVARATYMPDGGYKPIGGAHVPGTGDRTATFQLINGVGLYGGYAGFGAPDPDFRDIILHETILSGDLVGDDLPVPCIQDSPHCDSFGRLCSDGSCIIRANIAENAFHVVTGNGTDNTAILDGFTITAGNANEFLNDFAGGGGMLNSGYNANPTVAHCKFTGNSASGVGGAMNNLSGSSPTVTHSTFNGNSAGSGGGMFNTSSNPEIVHCEFSGNSAGSGAGMFNVTNSNPTVTHSTFCGNLANNGGGMFNSGSNPRVTNCAFLGNSASSAGGMINDFSSPTLRNCTFSGNSASNNGGAMFNLASSTPLVINCTFRKNSASNSGGGMYNRSTANPSVTNSILWENTDAGGIDSSAQIHLTGGTTVVNFSIVQGGWSGHGGVGMVNADPQFADPDGVDGHSGTADDDLRLRPGSPCIDAGNNAVVTAPTDLDGKMRRIDDSDTPDCTQAPGACGAPPIVDMGAYEFRSVPCGLADFDCDGDVDLYDFARWIMCFQATDPSTCSPFITPDLDGNTEVDLGDYLLFRDQLIGPG